MKLRLPSSFTFVAIPALCLGLLVLAWSLTRGDRGTAPEASPTLRVFAEESLKPSVDGLVAAFVRRSGIEVELAYVSAAGPETAPGGLLLWPAEGELSGSLAASEPAASAEGLRAYSLSEGESTLDAERFLDFLGGAFAAEILERQGAGRPLVPPTEP